MTITLVRPAPGGLTRYGIATPVRVRPAPAMEPPEEDTWRDGAADAQRRMTPSAPQDRHKSDEGYRAARRYVDLVAEVLGGFRPVRHLRPLTERGRFEQVAIQLARIGGPSVTRPGSGLVRVTGDRVRLRHLRVCVVHEEAAEAAAVLAHGQSVRAMTVRLERHSGVWLCTHLQVL
jgi:hypothetical protein